MESMGKVFDNNISEADARHNQNLLRQDGKEANPENVQVFSVDKVTVEKIVLESWNGSREVLLTKNESSTKSNVVKRTKDSRQKSTSRSLSSEDASFAYSKPKDTNFKTVILDSQSKLPIPKNRKSKFTKNPSIGSIAIDGLNSANTVSKRNKVPPKIPKKSAIEKEHNSSLIATCSTKEFSEDLLSNREQIVDKVLIKHEESGNVEKNNDDKNKCNKLDEIEKQDDATSVEVDRVDAQSCLEKNQATIEDLQRNLSTRIHASTAQSYREKLLANYIPRSSVTAESSSGFDKDFLEKHNLDKRLKIEEKRLLETDLDYTSDNDRTSETDVGRKYSEKVTEVEKRWSGEFLENRLQRNSSESSKSSYVEEFGSVSSRESIVEDRLLFAQKHPANFAERQTSIEEPKSRTSEEILLENSTVSTVDSDSCLEDRIKAVDEDIAHATNEIQTDDNVDVDELDRAYDNEEIKDRVRWNDENYRDEKIDNLNDTNSNRANNYKTNIEERMSEIFLVGENSFSVINSKESTFVLRNHRGKDGYANLIKEFAMEAGPSKMKKEEKQKKKLGFRRLLPAIFSPKDSRKDYKKKEQKERRRSDERHFVRYQQNGNYTRSPDTMNLNEDIKRNVRLDNSLNGSIIDERLDEIKRELFPEQGPITSTPDHFLQDDSRLLRDRSRSQRSYTDRTTDSSLSSIAPDERWIERGGQFVISPDLRKYEQRQKREELDNRRYNYLERKHSLQESSHGNRNYFFQRNHGSSGRISAPPGERYLRSRVIHVADRPLPEIPQSRLELSNYENYEDGIGQLCDGLSGVDVVDNMNYQNQSVLYQNDNTLPQSVPAEVKVTHQPIVNQTQRAPLVGRTCKYPSSGSSQKSGDYADNSSCTPNSSQKSEFSPSSSKSGEYYLNSPRSSARTSPTERERIYENEAQPVLSQPSSINYVEEHVYDETPSSPCREKHFSTSKDHATENSPEKKDSLNRQSPLKNISFHSCEDNEGMQAESKREMEKSREDCLKNYETQSESTASGQIERTSVPNVSPSKHGITIAMSPSGSRARRSQPNDQILIASPKREAICQSRISRPSNEMRLRDAESPIPIADSCEVISGIVPIEVRHQYGSQNSSAAGIRRPVERKIVSPSCFSKGISRPEPIYGYRRQRESEDTPTLETKEDKREDESSTESCIDERVARVQGQSSSPQNSPSSSAEAKQTLNESGRRALRSPTREQRTCATSSTSQDKMYTSASSLQHESIYEQRQRQYQPLYGQQSHPPFMLLSPSKRETRQHLEAFYWQQKALEAHRKSMNSVSSASSGARQIAPKIDLPDMREAVYWQQLKRLNEEQQRRIYERNAMEDRTKAATGLVVHGDNSSYWSNVQQRLKASPTGKLPLMQTQKGQNQPVLIVRPQQALRDRQEMSIKSIINPGYEGQRSKSASPHFHRSDIDRASFNVTCRRSAGATGIPVASPRKPEAGEIPLNPIFKRGSLIGGESIEYGSTGPKRVSFSNQPKIGPDLAAGSWPTKDGTATEPPTRRHKSEGSVSDTDSVFLHQDRRDTNPVACRSNVSRPQREYDANKPPPKDPFVISRRGTGAKNYVCNEIRWNSEEQRCQRRQEEEWNPDGKGRQSNDTGGSVRGEVEPGSNELTPGRRAGSGGGGGSVGGGGVLGVGVGAGGGSGSRGSSGGGRSRDEPRRHTLGGDHQPSLHHQQFNAAQQLHPLHPHHLPPPHGQYGTPSSRHTTMDLESPLPRGYPPPSSTMLFDDDPGIMSEVETSSTGFRRGGKQRSSLPVVRTPSKTLERPLGGSLGLVFLQYRNETKRALLPNEITSIDTVKALFVRSFPKQLTMEYLDSPHVKVYIHDSNKDMFYELEDLRSHLRDIRDRSVLRLFESADGVTGMPGPLGVPGGGGGLPPHWEDQSYFSEPEFDSEYQHQHIHKSKTAKNSTSGSGYYVGGSSTLPRGGSLLRAYSPAASSVGGPNATPTQPKTLTTPDGWIGGGGVPPAKPLRSYQCGKSPLGSLGGSARFSRDSSVSLYSIPDRLHGEGGYMSSPERGVSSGSGRYPPGPYSAGSSYEDPYYSQYSGTVTPVIDEEASDTELLEESYSLYGVKPPGRPPSGPPRSPFPSGAATPLPPGGQGYDVTRIRVEHMERQLANLTGLVQKALTHAPHTSPSPREYLQVPPGRDPYARAAGAGDEFDKHSSSSSASLPVSQPAVTDDSYLRTDVKPPKLGKDKSVSFEKSVSFSDEPPDMNSPKQHSPQHAADTKPTKPAIKSSTLPRMSSQERDRHKPTPPPKPAALVAGQYVYRDLALTPEMYNQLRGLQKKAKDLRQEVRNLRRMSQAQAHTVRETIRDTFITIRAMLLSGGDAAWTAGDTEKIRLSREEDLYKQEMIRLEKDLTELESTVEELRGNVINRKTRVNMSDVENMALILSKSSKTVADLKVRFPNLQEGMKGLLSSEMEKVVREEKFLKEEPERLESALRRCKKLTGTLVTLKRLASVQEQRLPNAASVDAEETPPITPTTAQHSKAAAPVPAERTVVGSASILGGGSHPHESSADPQQRPENALDALLDELQTFSRPGSQLGHVSSSLSVHPGSNVLLADIGRASSLRETSSITASSGTTSTRPPSISDIGRKGSVDSSSGPLTAVPTVMVGLPGMAPGASGTLRRLHSYPSSSDTDTSPPIARLQALSLQEQQSSQQQPAVLPQAFLPGQKPPVPERNVELLQLASARRVPPPPPPRTSSRSPLASPTSPQLPPRNHPCNLQSGNATLRRPATRGGKPPMALPADSTATEQVSGDRSAPPNLAAPTHNSSSSQSSAVLSTSNSSSCESVNSQEGLQSKRGRQEQLEQRHQELLRKQKALQEQYARLQQLQRNAAGLTTVPPAPPDLLKKTGSESNLLAKMGLGLSAASSGSLTSLSLKPQMVSQEAIIVDGNQVNKIEITNGQILPVTSAATTTTTTTANQVVPVGIATSTTVLSASTTTGSATTVTTTSTTTTSKVYETDIL
ncbi:uncharacterized protein LOC114946604 isoform X5 [Nylanderia fulva]|uniref:uncharacterized protein LOC114946604 isoform X5 n=1 Tax=Nylanderia fulva TaxID=613905 RepID=UPI0010FB970A|nr:uncharacterized protein LOC114946604 isoform X5 [Nylanderia fulva]